MQSRATVRLAALGTRNLGHNHEERQLRGCNQRMIVRAQDDRLNGHGDGQERCR